MKKIFSSLLLAASLGVPVIVARDMRLFNLHGSNNRQYFAALLHAGYFSRPSRGKYEITPKGKQFIERTTAAIRKRENSPFSWR